MSQILLDATNNQFKTSVPIKGYQSVLALGHLVKSVAGSANVTLSSTEYESTILEFTGALTGNINVVVPITDGALFEVFNNTTGNYTLTVIGVSGTGVTVTQGKKALLYCDGTNIVAAETDAAALGVMVASRLSKSVAGSADVTLTLAEAFNRSLQLTGAIGANINVIVPTTYREYVIYNNTSGAFTLTVKTASGTGIVVGSGKRAILECDGTNVVRLTADV